MPAATVTDVKYAFKFTGSPSGRPASIATLVDGGPLLVHEDHVIVTILPDAVDKDTFTPRIATSMHFLDSTCTAGLLFDDALSRSGGHYMVTP